MVSGEESGGGFALVEHPIPPGHLAAPVHRRSRKDEYSFVLEGRLGARLGGDVVHAEVGDLAFKFDEVAEDSRSPEELTARYGMRVDLEGVHRVCEEHGRAFPPLPRGR